MASNPAQQLITHGQSVWYDNISRDLLKSGELKRLIKEWGVRGITSNPTIFDQAISKSSSYDEQIKQLAQKTKIPDEIFIEIALEDIKNAAQTLLPLYQESCGNDGFVSIEVSPLLARDTKGTISEGKKLFERLALPNIMVKVPGTPEGIPAVRALLEEGVNINITLLFSVDNYRKVAETYCEALRARVAKGLPVAQLRSVASFFVSRVDTLFDAKLEQVAKSSPAKAKQAQALLGKFGIANCKIAYQSFQDIFLGRAFADLKAKGAAVQRPLWASTGVKNPAYSDVLYVEELIGRDTVNTMPHQTLQAFADHGRASADMLLREMEQAMMVPQQLAELGLDVEAGLQELQVDGVKKFSESFTSLNKTIATKLS